MLRGLHRRERRCATITAEGNCEGAFQKQKDNAQGAVKLVRRSLTKTFHFNYFRRGLAPTSLRLSTLSIASNKEGCSKTSKIHFYARHRTVI